MKSSRENIIIIIIEVGGGGRKAPDRETRRIMVGPLRGRTMDGGHISRGHRYLVCRQYQPPSAVLDTYGVL